jgi:putative MATE family efflux protein
VQVGMTGRQGLDMAMRAMVSRAVGAGDIARANHVALQAFTLSGAFSVLMALIGVFFTEPLLAVLGVPDNVIAAGADYMRIQFVGSGTNAFRMMSGAALQSAGDTLTPMRSATVSRFLHVVLSPMFVFGWLVFPEIGLMGAAMANILAQGVGAVMNFRALFMGTSKLHLTLRGYRPDFRLLVGMIKTGLPASVTSAERSIAQLLLVGIVSPYGATTLAAYALTRRIENLVMMGARGLGQGAGVLVGQNLGAGKPERARKTVAWALLYVFGINLVTVIALVLFTDFFIGIFNNDQELLEVAVTWLQIAALGYLFLGIGQVFQQSYNTAGDTMVPMLVTLVSLWLVQQPLALVLPDAGLGHYGIAWAVVAAVFVRLLIYAPYYFTNRWLRVSI